VIVKNNKSWFSTSDPAFFCCEEWSKKPVRPHKFCADNLKPHIGHKWAKAIEKIYDYC